MRLELHAAEAGSGPRPPLTSRSRRLPDAFEWAVLALLGVLSLWTVGLDVWRASEHGLAWTHTDGLYIVDQMQYLSWIRSAAAHGLTSNLFVLRSTPADYFQPAVTISAALYLLGIPVWLALLFWKPVAVICVFAAYRAYVHRSVGGRTPQRVALVLALFFGCYTLVFGNWSVIGDLMPVFLSWGYTFGLLALGLMVLALLAYERARERGRLSPLAGLLGAVAGLLHPWHGELLGVILIGSEAVLWTAYRQRSRRGLEQLLLTCVLTGLPLLYYMVLGRTDMSWHLARDASKHTFPLWPILLASAPLAVPALLAWRPPQARFIDVSARIWPLASLIVWVLGASALSATPLHAIEGLTLPLAVLALHGMPRLRPERLPGARWWLVAVVLLLTVPATAKLMDIADQLAAPTTGNSNFISLQERAALRYIAKAPEAGGVFTRSYLGAAVPALTGRRTFIGDCLWSEPGCLTRTALAQNLMDGQMSAGQARRLVQESGARFVLTDCQQPADLRSLLGPLVQSVHSFGCSSVYVLTPSPDRPEAALTESALNAALRASGRQ